MQRRRASAVLESRQAKTHPFLSFPLLSEKNPGQGVQCCYGGGSTGASPITPGGMRESGERMGCAQGLANWQVPPPPWRGGTQRGSAACPGHRWAGHGLWAAHPRVLLGAMTALLCF